MGMAKQPKGTDKEFSWLKSSPMATQWEVQAASVKFKLRASYFQFSSNPGSSWQYAVSPSFKFKLQTSDF